MTQVATDRITSTPRWSFEWSPPIISNDEPKHRLIMRFKTYTAGKMSFYTEALVEVLRAEGNDAAYERIANAAWSKFDHGKTTPYDRVEFITDLRRWLKTNGLP